MKIHLIICLFNKKTKRQSIFNHHFLKVNQNNNNNLLNQEDNNLNTWSRVNSNNKTIRMLDNRSFNKIKDLMILMDKLIFQINYKTQLIHVSAKNNNLSQPLLKIHNQF